MCYDRFSSSGFSVVDGGRLPAIDKMAVRRPGDGKDFLKPVLQSKDLSSFQLGDVDVGRSKAPSISAPAARQPYADMLIVGGNERGLRADLDMSNDNRRREYPLAGLNPLPYSFDEHLRIKDGMGVYTPMHKDGRPAIILTEEKLFDLSKPLQLTLIGKFPSGRPKWGDVNKFFFDLKLRGEYKIANLDARHLYIHLQHMDDYIRMFSKQFQYINGFLMKFLKWTLDFNVCTEQSVCPVWISLPLMGLHLYNSDMLFAIASVYGRPLRLDYATRHWSRPSSARILVEMDVKTQYSNEVWIGRESNGYFQKVLFENLPRYCMQCQKIGHSDENCFILFPELRKEHVYKNLIGKRQHIDDELAKGLEVVNNVECGGCGVPSSRDTQVSPVGDDPIINGVDGLDLQGITHGAGVVTLECDDGLLQEDLLDGNVSSLDISDGQALLGSNKQLLQFDDVGKVFNQRDGVSIDGGSMGSDLDISPCGDFLLSHGDSFDFSIAGCNFHNKASTSKRFTRSSLKDIDGQ